MQKAVKKRRVGRPPGRKAPHRPVLSARVPAEVYAMIAAAARKSGRTLSEEVVWRAQQSVEWEAAFVDAKKVLADAQHAAGQDLKEMLHRHGYRYVPGATGGGAWFAPGVNAVAWIFDNSNREVLEELLDRAAMRALEKSRRES